MGAPRTCGNCLPHVGDGSLKRLVISERLHQPIGRGGPAIIVQVVVSKRIRGAAVAGMGAWQAWEGSRCATGDATF
jgi:hypothetical protein